MGKKTAILGISCYYHDSAAALVVDGKVVAAAQEERFNREKYSYVFPIEAINYCLQAGEISIYDLDYVGFYEKPYLKLARTMIGHVASWPGSFSNFLSMMPTWLEDRLAVPVVVQRELGYEGEVLFVKHHLSHAASSFLHSPFEEAAILTVDGIGEWASTTYGRGKGTEIEVLKELRYPNSVGLLYAIVSTYLGFRVFTGEGKVMALAAYGKPTYQDKFAELLDLKPDGSFRLNPRYFSFNRGNKMYNKRFEELLGPERQADADFEQHHFDIAATLQYFTEEILLRMARHVHKVTGLTKLCMAGGVFLNVVANSRILKETPIDDVFIQPAAGDAGAALGVASYIHHCLLNNPRCEPMKNAYLGPGFTPAQLRRVLQRDNAPFKELPDQELADFVAERIAAGEIVAWFEGRMEYGPRALGARSILADVRDPDMKQTINDRVKFREWFRPYGVAVLEEHVSEFFDLDRPSPYMLLVGDVPEDKQKLIPSAVHIDGTSRIQTVNAEQNGVYYKVVEAFHKLTGVPMIINTSFNVQEPIICTPEEAWATFKRADMDWLALGNFLVRKKDLAP